MSDIDGPPTAEFLASLANPWAFMMRRYGRRPGLFVREVWGAAPQAWQDKPLAALEAGHRRLSVRSGHGVGKSTELAWVAIWFLLTRSPVKIVITAPSASQLYDALWAELLAWINRLPVRWRQLLDVTSDRVALLAAPAESFITARTSRAESPEVMQGIHSRHVMLLADEASGVPDAVFEASHSAMSTPGAIMVLAGNPNYASGFFFKTHTDPALSARWWTMKVACQDSTMADPEFAREIADTYGENSNAYRVRVLGEFPLADGDAWIPLNMVEEAMRRVAEIDESAPEIWGLDLARQGSDQSCLVKRRGYVMTDPPRRLSGMDSFQTMNVVGFVMAEWNMLPDQARPAAIGVDTIGIGGPVADRLREQGLPIVDVNVSETSSHRAVHRVRDELWWNMREWIQSGRVSMPLDEPLKNAMCAAKYGYLSDGKLRIEGKDQVRSRLGRSPDDADALALTLSSSVITTAGAAAGGRSWSKPLRRNLGGIV